MKNDLVVRSLVGEESVGDSGFLWILGAVASRQFYRDLRERRRRPLRIRANSSQPEALGDLIEVEEAILLEALGKQRGLEAIFEVG